MRYLLILLFPFAANSQTIIADTSYYNDGQGGWTKVVSYRNQNTTVFATAAKLQIKTDSLATALAASTASTYFTIASAAGKLNTNGNGSALTGLTAVQVTGLIPGLPGYASVKRIADTTLLLTTLANVGDLKFTVTAGTYYHFKYVLTYSSPALTTGIRISLTYPAVTVAAASVTIHGLAADGAASEWSGTINSSGDIVTGTGVAVINQNYLVVIEGSMLPSASGTITLQMGSEIAASGVILKRGSIGYLWTL